MINLLEDYICADRFMEMADVVYETGYLDRDDDWNPLPRTFHKRQDGFEKIEQQNCIIFCKRDYVETIFELVRKSKFKHVLITMNCDFNVEGYEFDAKPDNIVYWFAQNVNAKRENLIPLPLGIERKNGGGVSYDYKAMIRQLEHKKEIKNLIYMNHSDGNHPSRPAITEYYKKMSCVTHVSGGRTFEEFLDDMYNHSFILSPRGNGMDCHRTWEAMYMGTTPIVENNFVNDYFSDLPMLVVDDLTKLDPEVLIKHYVKHFESYNAYKCDFPMLKFGYWKNYINRCMDEIK